MKIEFLLVACLLPSLIDSHFFNPPANRRFMFSRLPSFFSSIFPKNNRFKRLRPPLKKPPQSSYLPPRPPMIKYKRPGMDMISYKPVYPSPYHAPKYPLVTYNKPRPPPARPQHQPVHQHQPMRPQQPMKTHHDSKPHQNLITHLPVSSGNNSPHQGFQTYQPKPQKPQKLVVHHMVPDSVKMPHVQDPPPHGYKFGVIRQQSKTRHLSGFGKPRPYSIIEIAPPEPKPEAKPEPASPASKEKEVNQNSIEHNIKGMLPPPPMIEKPSPISHSVMIATPPPSKALKNSNVQQQSTYTSAGSDETKPMSSPKVPLFVYQNAPSKDSAPRRPPPPPLPPPPPPPPTLHSSKPKTSPFKAGSLVVNSIPPVNAGVLPLANEKPPEPHRFPPYV